MFDPKTGDLVISIRVGGQGLINRISADGSAVTLTDDGDSFDPSVSKDGLHLVFAKTTDGGDSGDAAQYVLRAIDPLISCLGAAAVAPSSGRITFLRAVGDYNYEIFVLEPDGSGRFSLWEARMGGSSRLVPLKYDPVTTHEVVRLKPDTTYCPSFVVSSGSSRLRVRKRLLIF